MTNVSRKKYLSNRENCLQENGILNCAARPRYISSTRSIKIFNFTKVLLKTSGRIKLNLAYKNRKIQTTFKDFIYVLEGYSEVLL